MKNNDVKLINRILAGDESAFVDLVNKYQKQVHALAWRKIGDFHIAEEITQDTFLKVYQKLSTLKDPNQFAGWLYVIATNQCRAWLRKKRIETEPLEETDVEKIEEAYSQYIVEERANATVETQREVVKKLLAKLKESERTVMTLHYFGEMTTEEISRFLGVSTSAIKLRLHRARQRLKKEEPMIREALSNFKLSPNITDTIMQKVERIKPAVPSGSKPIIPWVIGASSIVLIVLMLVLGGQYLAHFQQPYSLDSQSELVVELIDAPIVLDLEAKPDIRNQLGANANNQGNNSHGEGQDSNQVGSNNVDYTQWNLPEYAKARLGKGCVGEVAYSPDGNRLAVASGTGIWLYDAHTGNELALLTGHTGKVRSVGFSPDGSTIASGSEDNTVVLWDAITREPKHVLIGHENIVTSVVFSPNGSILASGSFDGYVRLWDVTTGGLKNITPESRSSITQIVFNPGGDTIAGSTLTDNVVHLWDAATGKLKTTLEIDSQFAVDVAFSLNGEKIAINSSDHSIHFWDVSTRQCEGTLYRHRTNIMDIVFSPDGNTFASICFDGTLRLWDYNEEFLRKLRIGRNQPKATFKIERMRRLGWMHVLFGPDSRTIACAGEDGTLLILDANTGMQKTSILGHTNRVSSIAFSPDGSRIASGRGQQVLLWDVNTTEIVTTFNTNGLGVRVVTFDQSGSTLASGNEDNTLLLWDMKTKQLKSKIVIPPLETNRVSWIAIAAIAFSPDGNTLASIGGNEDFSVYLWDVATGELQATLKGHTNIIQSIAFSPDGNNLVSCASEEIIRLWDVATGQQKDILKGHTDIVYSLAFSSDGKTLASGAGLDDKSIILWDMVTKEKKVRLEGDTGWILTVAFSPDGKTLASGGTDKKVIIWDIYTKQQIAVFQGHKSNVVCVAYSPDGKTLASGSSDGTILLWDVPSMTNTD